MSAHDTSVAQMVNTHALWAVKVKIFLAIWTFREARRKVLFDHLRVILKRQARLGKGKREAIRSSNHNPVTID
jgi:hypothetical protein